MAVEVGEDEEDDDRAAVGDENLGRYLKYLKKETVFPVTVTGIEDMGCFGWEERYTFGGGSRSEYENLKKKYPSFTDKYELLSFSEDFDEDEGLCAEVRRISDGKKFTLPLADLKTVEKNSKNSQLLDDYTVWYVNFG
ncbi:MAG: calcium-binding protein [Desulfobacterales bacterium]